jgi:hypothetical protein
MTGTETPMVLRHRNRVTGGILRISLRKSIASYPAPCRYRTAVARGDPEWFVDVKAKVELKTDVEEGRLRWNATLARKFFMKSFAVPVSHQAQFQQCCA